MAQGSLCGSLPQPGLLPKRAAAALETRFHFKALDLSDVTAFWKSPYGVYGHTQLTLTHYDSGRDLECSKPLASPLGIFS